MTPAQFLNYHVSVQENLANMDWVVAANFVVWHPLVLAGLLVVEEGVRDFVFQRNEALISIGMRCVLTAVRAGFRLHQI